MRYKLFCLFVLTSLLPLNAQPKLEVRAAWITTAYALDWPRTKATSATTIERQKSELIQILDQLQIANFNTVLFQARTRGEVFYKSAFEPYSALLTGKVGKDPGYDPLTFVIEECHKRGMECHAWIITLSTKNGYLNPARKETKQLLLNLTREITDKYDIDGIHLDYLRYPEKAKTSFDSREFRQLGKGKSLMQFRRDNLTEILRSIYQEVKKEKPWVKVSTSPVGKFRDTSRYSSGNWNAYHTVYQDVERWLNEGLQDQIYPMMYFRGNHFYPFALDWQESSNGRQVIPGLGIYFLDPKEGDWKREEIERQIHFTRNNGLSGQGFYRAQFLMENTQGIYDELNEHYYALPALTPPITWIDSVPPSVPLHPKMVRQNGSVTLSWEASTDNDPRNAPRYIIYGSNFSPVDTNKASSIVATYVTETQYTYTPDFPWEEWRYFAVSAIDRYGNESEAIQIDLPLGK